MTDFTEIISETAYLSAPNAAQYRVIMRTMYTENQNYHADMYPTEILSLVKEHEGFASYTIVDLKSDLDQLVSWNNLIAIQDPGIVHTIAEYKNKQYRYSISQRAIEVERMTLRLENLDIEKGNLSTNYFLRIEEALRNAENIEHMSLQEVNEWWNLMNADYRAMSDNYHDYLQEFNNPDSRNLMQSVAFILHKDRFVQYLRNFIRQMQLEARKIRALLEKVDIVFESQILPKIIESELALPRLSTKTVDEEALQKVFRKQWVSFERWFKPMRGQVAECDKIMELTNTIIRSMIENANMIVQMNNYGISRKDDYRHFIQLFTNVSSLEEAHCLGAHLFGIQQIEHVRVNQTVDAEDVRVSAFRREENVMELESHSRTYRERRSKEGFIDRTFDKQIAFNEYEFEMRKRKELVQKYIHDGKLSVADMSGVIPEAMRKMLLTWISLANMTVTKTASTEFGQKFHLLKEEGTCILHCEDGNLTMPKYVLEFDDERN